MPQPNKLACFATTNRGLEPLLKTEFETLGAEQIIALNAGIRFVATLEDIMRINLSSRLASRVMIEVGSGLYHHEDDIYELAYSIDWSRWFNVNNTIKVATTAINSPLKSLDFITLRIKDAICDHFVNLTNIRPDVDKKAPDVKIYTFLSNDSVTIYLDTSGEALFKRGYRESKLEAPLKENLAAGLIYLSKWDHHTPLYDPMCGSGTIIIEALEIALNVPPGLNREFAFSKLKPFNIQYFNELKKRARTQIKSNLNLKVYIGDINSKAVEMTKEKLTKLKLMQYVNIIPGDFLKTFKPSDSGIIISNLPYGIRLEEQDTLAELYPKIATHLKNNYTNWRCFFLTADMRIKKLMRLKPSSKFPVFNGALDCRLFEFKMVAGSNR